MSRIVLLLWQLVLLPFRLVWFLLRMVGRGLGALLGPILDRVDRSPKLSRLINSLSSSMATQRGLLLMVGTGIMILSLVVHGIVVLILIINDVVSSYLYLMCIPFGLLHAGVLFGFIGILIAVPLGQGFKSQQQ